MEVYKMSNIEEHKEPYRFKSLSMWVSIIVVGFIFFVVSQIPFQMGYFGGYKGINLTIIGLLQATLVIPLIYFGLRYMKIDLKNIGVSSKKWIPDTLLGVSVAVGWAIIQFAFIIPNTGGADRADISGILTMLDRQWINILWYLPLGIIGGGITEEIYNRGFFIGVIRNIFNGSKIATFFASILAIIFFAAGHLPTNLVEWIDLLIPSVAYTILFVYTGRLAASIVAHSLWNTLAVILVFIIYG